MQVLEKRFIFAYLSGCVRQTVLQCPSLCLRTLLKHLVFGLHVVYGLPLNPLLHGECQLKNGRHSVQQLSLSLSAID